MATRLINFHRAKKLLEMNKQQVASFMLDSIRTTVTVGILIHDGSRWETNQNVSNSKIAIPVIRAGWTSAETIPLIANTIIGRRFYSTPPNGAGSDPKVVSDGGVLENEDFSKWSREDLLVYVGTLRTQLDEESRKVMARDNAIGYRSRREKIQKLIISDHLLTRNMTRFQRILLAVTIPMTSYAIILQNNLVASGITPYEYALAFDEFYDDLSIRFNHYGKAPTPKTETEWNELFSYFGATDVYEQESIRISLQELPLSSTVEFSDDQRLRSNRYFILLENVSFNAKKTDVDALLRTVDPQGIIKTHFVTKFKDQPTGYVAVEFQSNTNDIEKIRTTICSYQTEPFKRKNFNVLIIDV